MDPPETNKSPEQTQQSEPIASAEPEAPSRQALEEGATQQSENNKSPKRTQVPVPLSSEFIPQFPERDEEVSNFMTGEDNLHSQTDRAMIPTNELPENTVGFNNTTLGPMTYRDLDEVDYSGPTKKLREQLYAANMELKLRRVETNIRCIFYSVTYKNLTILLKVWTGKK